ncbi:MAG: tRNA lysidine(34) synthetase TilS [Candidatus Marinimicrobia bacterium CG08_land_8_20_14_0_20_45_22]|nr:MAG: tRNA lysidine(34) synthetase TilS [Candidatus Marinimicrobia bacterium CG08_land_8_20_14_0_20_45_22]
MQKLIIEFKHFLKKHHLLENVETVVVGLSGGADSVVMTHLFSIYQNQFNIQIIAVHVNHQLRSTESDGDETFVRKFCEQMKIPLFTTSVDVKNYAKEHNLSDETAGHELRYAFFSEVAERYKNSIIATAHTADDQAETVLLRFLRGSSLKGLEGILLKRGNIIRPLLFSQKEQIYGYAEKNHLQFREDSTNFQECCLRNIIRNSIIPKITKELNPGLIKTTNEMAKMLSEVHDAITRYAVNALTETIVRQSSHEIVLEISRLKNYFIAVEKEIIRQGLYQLESNYQAPGNKAMEQIVTMIQNGLTGKWLKMTDSIFANVDRDNLVLYKREPDDWDGKILREGETLQTKSFQISCQVSSIEEFRSQDHHRNIEFIDRDLIEKEITVRKWQNGDKLKPFGFSGIKKVSDIFINNKIPVIKKDRIPLLTGHRGIIWVCGLAIANEYRITHRTQNILKLTYMENDI